ncbi:MAG: SurA N-terminal domain-containing protein [Nitrospirae bacterium]|nr:SurA N-terminal domain-containing protein [Nitrospirota bacterium]
MLKIMQSHKFFTVFVLGAITIMISVAFIFWGIGPKDNPQDTFVASVEDEKITIDEYWRTYDNELKRLKEQNKSPEEIEKLNLKDRVINSLINRSVLLIAARKAGITVTENELQEAIINTQYFQRNGVFDMEIYQRALRFNRLTPQAFEDSVSKDIVISKISNFIRETAELTPEELTILNSMNAGNNDQLRAIFRSSKSNQAISAYVESIKRRMVIKINKDQIS